MEESYNPKKDDYYMKKIYSYMQTLNRYGNAKHRIQDKKLLPNLLKSLLRCIKDVRENIPEKTRNYITIVKVDDKTLNQLEKECLTAQKKISN